jgi:serine/threonine protein kinase
MPADLAEQLQTSLGSSYTIVRELGGGGMSRVFLAEDKALERSVVINVLHPKLAAGVNAERFKREVQVSARLQHPHVVPVLTSARRCRLVRMLPVRENRTLHELLIHRLRLKDPIDAATPEFGLKH